jgi:lipopolysaccharide transport system permease protein/teichoic acid transport system permease protein
VVLLIGFGWILSSLNLFKRDLMHALPGILGILFWLTPIVWDERMIPEKYRFLLNINPMYHIVKVYRGALFEKSVFWFDIYSLLFFWFIALFSVICGFYIFNSLRDYFTEID